MLLGDQKELLTDGKDTFSREDLADNYVEHMYLIEYISALHDGLFGINEEHYTNITGVFKDAYKMYTDIIRNTKK